MGCVYSATCKVSGKAYIGLTVMTLKRRIARHLSHARHGSKWPFHSAIRKYGEDAFEWTILHESDSRESLGKLETVMIALISTRVPCGYNLTSGGDGVSGWRHTDESKRKLSESLRGRTFSDEHRRHLSEGAKRKRLSAEHKRRISAGGRGKQQGETNPQSKLTVADVRSLRGRYAAGGVTYKDLSRVFGIHEVHVGIIVRREAWQHVS